MNDHIKVSVNQMHSDYVELTELIDRLPDAMKELESTMETLASCWEGVAWESFQKQVSSDIDNMSKLYRFLLNYVSHVETGRQKYFDAEVDAYYKAKNYY